MSKAKTRKKKAKKTLRKKVVRRRSILDSIKNQAIFTLDARGVITSWNIGAKDIFGYTSAEILGKHFSILFISRDRAKHVPQKILKETPSGRDVEEKYKFIRKNKGTFIGLTLIQKQKNKGSRRAFVVVVKVARDEKKHEEILKTYTTNLEIAKMTLEREKLEDGTILESIDEGVIATDKKGRIVVINEQARQMFDIKSKEVYGKHFSDIWDTFDENGELVPLPKCAISIVIHTGERLKKSDHSYLTCSKKRLLATAVTTPLVLHGKTVGAVSVFREWKEREIDRAKSELISLASHQLRTPLTAIKLFTEILLSEPERLEPDQLEILNNIEQSNEKMIKFIDYLLTISHKDSGKIDTKRVQVHLAELVQTIVNEMQHVAEMKNSRIVFSTAIEPVVRIDPNLIREVLDNLINNAITYSPAGSIIAVKLEKNSEGNHIISVADKGIGIPDHVGDKIFEKFYRAKNALEVKNEGNGLGLYICRVIMESFGGTIWYESKEGQGTTFFISF